MEASVSGAPGLRPTDWRALPAEEADRLAWKAICKWPTATGFDPVIDGIDYSLLARFYLRHKVARAIRRIRDPEDGRFEEALLAEQSATSTETVKAGPWWLPGERWERLKGPLRPIVRHLPGVSVKIVDQSLKPRDYPEVFVAAAHPLWKRTLDALRSCGMKVHVGEGPWGTLAAPDGRAACQAARPFAVTLCLAIGEGLGASGVKLAAEDTSALESELATCRATIDIVTLQLEELKPSLLVTFADDHPPHMEYVLAARRERIPSLMIQHGLDCEQLTLDHAFADYVAVWGAQRRERYRQRSAWQPSAIEVTGNPEFDHLRLPVALAPPGPVWLWVTRPHTPDKCDLPSLGTGEGLAILDGLLSAVAERPQVKLIIKPHPFDYTHLYQSRIQESGLGDRVSLSRGSLYELLDAASVVFSEDSTAGMEAMFFGKRVIHAHFAPSPPSMPFAEYQAALPAFDKGSLQGSIRAVGDFSSEEAQRMLDGQRRFLQAYNGPCDGNAAKRLSELVVSVVRQSRS